jgi:hypothetical protein
MIHRNQTTIAPTTFGWGFFCILHQSTAYSGLKQCDEEKAMSEPSKNLSSIVRTWLTALPSVGGPLSTAWSEWETNQRTERIESTLRQITDRLIDIETTVNPTKIDASGMQLLELVLREAEIEASERKRRRFADLLASYWLSDELSPMLYDEATLFLRATREFTESHISVLHNLNQADESAAVPYEQIKALVEVEDLSGVTGMSAVCVMDDLCGRFGFVKRSWTLNQDADGNSKKSSLLMTGNLSPEGIARKCFHAITKRGVRYVEFVLRCPRIA